MNAFNIGLSDFKNNLPGVDSFQDMLLIAELNMQTLPKEKSLDSCPLLIHPNALTMIFISKGTMHVSIDFCPYTLHANDFLMIMPSHVFQFDDVSTDFNARVVILDGLFIKRGEMNFTNPTIVNFMEVRKYPVVQLNKEENKFLNEYIDLIKEKMHLNDHLLQSTVVKLTFVSFFVEIFNIMMRKDVNVLLPQQSRQEEIMNKFLELLVKNCKEEHSVSFYADKLFITPQHLSHVLKTLTGKTANLLIDQAIMIEATVLLRANKHTIQQIADKLHFSDQSSFGKFFRKYAGTSPGEYRKNIVDN